GASFALDYPTNALLLVNSQSYHSGSLVPSGALAAWNTLQNGHLSLAISTASEWPASNGVLAELTFQVQPGASGQYAWPLTLSGSEITRDGYQTRTLLPTSANFIGRDPVAGHLSAAGRDDSGRF